MGAGARTALLMLALTAMFLIVGLALGVWLGNVTAFLTAAFMLAMVFNLLGYWYADRWVLRLYRAKLVSEAEEPELHEMVSKLASSAGLPKPRVAVVPMDAPNAFATGRSPARSVVAVTRGALRLLDRDQLEGVLGHELAHIKNRDMLINTLAAMVAGAIAYVSLMGRWSIFLGGGDRDRGGAGLLALLVLILAPIAALLIRLSISRSREYEADREGARISRKPRALADALRALEAAARSRPLREGNPATSHLFIVNPFRGGMSLAELFSTHPPIEKRIQRLEQMALTGLT